jgi:1-deoxy-D-xylulose-5-phosphate synthase
MRKITALLFVIQEAPELAQQLKTDLDTLPFGQGERERVGQKIAIVAFGPLLYAALSVAEELNLTVLNMRWAKPLDEALLISVAKEHHALVTLEDSALMGGAGSAVLEVLQQAQIVKPVLMLGLKDQFTEHGDPAKLMSMAGLDAPGIRASIC